jgi:hypothetical protein
MARTQPSSKRRTDAICSEERVEDREEVLETSTLARSASLESLGGQPVVNHAFRIPRRSWEHLGTIRGAIDVAE